MIFNTNKSGNKPGSIVYLIAVSGIILLLYNACRKELPAEAPSLVTINITNLTPTSLTSGGLVFSPGGDPVISRGICISTRSNPEISDTRTEDGSGTGSFTSTISGLIPGTTYYLRAYATNNIGTGYGNQYVIMTTEGTTSITTTAASSITAYAALSGGNITSDGGSQVTRRGVCWSTVSGPTTSNSITMDGSGSGSFASNITGLTPGTKYYVRAYAINGTGTFYGNEISFVTECVIPAAPGTITGSISVPANTTGVTYSILPVSGAARYNWLVPSGAVITSGQGTTDIRVDFGSAGGNVSVRSESSCGNSSYTDLPVIVTVITGCGTVTDIDGNVYNTVTIGTQCWFAENLKTLRYRNGDPIPNETDMGAWAALTTGAYCWYNNDEAANKSLYGALYNWYAVNDSRSLCPTGYHVPSNTEWTTLENYLITNGYNYDGSTSGNNIAKALGSVSGWNPSSVQGAVGNNDYPSKKNASGFNGLPGGVRDSNQMIFGSVGNFGMWWTSTEDSPTTAWDRGLANYTTSLGRLNVLKSHGFSVRCIKD